MIPISSSIISACPANNMSSIIQHGDVYMELSDDNYKSKLQANQEDGNLKSKFSKSKADYLSVETVRKMIERFLTEKKIPEQKLAESLGIPVKSLLQLCSSQFPSSLIPRINLHLIKLYCETNFNNQEEKKRCN